MFKRTQLMLSATLVATSFLIVPSVQAETTAAKEQVTKMDAFLCKDIMRLSSDERAIALGVLHGYYLGKAGATQYVSSKLGKQSDDFIEYCLDHPNDQALSTFAKFAK